MKFKVGDTLKDDYGKQLFKIVGLGHKNYLIEYPDKSTLFWDIGATDYLWAMAKQEEKANHPNTNIFK